MSKPDNKCSELSWFYIKGSSIMGFKLRVQALNKSDIQLLLGNMGGVTAPQFGHLPNAALQCLTNLLSGSPVYSKEVCPGKTQGLA